MWVKSYKKYFNNILTSKKYTFSKYEKKLC